jgi:DNA polymerase-3 subunit epsilon
VLGEFQTLVRPGEQIPPFIAVLTGITDAMVATRTGPGGAARVPGVRAGAVLVAHNAPFDVGFLRAACAETGMPGRRPRWWTPPGWPARC